MEAAAAAKKSKKGKFYSSWWFWAIVVVVTLMVVIYFRIRKEKKAIADMVNYIKTDPAAATWRNTLNAKATTENRSQDEVYREAAVAALKEKKELFFVRK